MRIGPVASTASAVMLFTKPIPSTVSSTPISTRLGSARPTIDVPIATPEPRWKWPRITPTGQRDHERNVQDIRIQVGQRARVDVKLVVARSPKP